MNCDVPTACVSSTSTTAATRSTGAARTTRRASRKENRGTPPRLTSQAWQTRSSLVCSSWLYRAWKNPPIVTLSYQALGLGAGWESGFTTGAGWESGFSACAASNAGVVKASEYGEAGSAKRNHRGHREDLQRFVDCVTGT